MMDLASPAPGSPRPGLLRVSTVVELNVGGDVYVTTVGTLKKIPGTILANMVSGLTKVYTDRKGRFFIDRPGTYFGPILDYLRNGQLPTAHIPEVYREAQFYNINPLVKLLEDTPQIFGEQVARKQFTLRVPGYSESLELLVRLARAEAVAARSSSVVVCAVRTDEDDARCAELLHTLEAGKTSVVKFGPWKAPPKVQDLMDCVKMDIEAQGYKVHYDRYEEKVIWGKASTCFFTFTFTWW